RRHTRFSRDWSSYVCSSDLTAWRAAGIVPMFANGNDGPAGGTVGLPGGYPHSIGVGATDINDNIASFSSRGPITWDGVEYVKPRSEERRVGKEGTLRVST